jgi:ribonucleoside-diphosphate reductase alpha chain
MGRSFDAFGPYQHYGTFKMKKGESMMSKKMKTMSAIPAKAPKPQFADNAIAVLERRYLMKDVEGNVIEEPQEMLWRVASTISSADIKYDKKADLDGLAMDFYTMMAEFDFMPNSPTLMNAGRELGQLSACFVLPVEDSMESIFEAVKQTALIHKSGGGTGFSFSRIRPQNDMVYSTKGVSSGPISFMGVFDTATETIKQGGTRRGANMAMLRVDHPDIMDFIKVKADLTKLNNFNISVAITDAFMQAVENDEDYDIINPRDKEVVARKNARKVFKQIVKQAWFSGEPGIVFIDRMNADNPTPELGAFEATNPCGEQPLLPHESCNLGSINLSTMVVNGTLDYDKLADIVGKAVHFLDNVVELNRYPLEQIKKVTQSNRKVGLGVMGFADMLIKLGIPYSSPEAEALAGKVMKFIDDAALQASSKLATIRGSFPNFKKSIYYTANPDVPVRNATRTTIAPTGTISILAGCSSGVEPLFAISYVRRIMDGDEFFEVNPVFEKMAKDNGFYSKALLKDIAEKGTLQGLTEIPAKYRKIFETAHDITPRNHIDIQAAFQAHVNNAVSKTINFSHTATEEDVHDAYMLSYKQGCKGVTIYRDGCRDNQVLSTGTTEAKKDAVAKDGHRTKRDRPRKLTGSTYQMETGCGPMYVTINEDEQGRPFELFNTVGKAGGCASSQCEALGRLVSLAWRSGQDAEPILHQLVGISCHKPFGFGENKILSCADAIAKAVQQHLEANGTCCTPCDKTHQMFGACPECGGVVEHEGGCCVCHACGYSECG